MLVYAVDSGEKTKRKIAVSLLSEQAAAGQVLLSAQVLQEFYVTTTKKIARPLSEEEALSAVRQLSGFPIVPIDSHLVIEAVVSSQRYWISFWDALVVEAARSGGAAILYSEDLQHEQNFHGVTVRNPFS